MRPRWSSGPNSPQFEPGGFCFHLCAIKPPNQGQTTFSLNTTKPNVVCPCFASVLALVVMPADPLGHERRLRRAFDLDRGVPSHLHAVAVDGLVPQQGEARTHA